MAGRQPAHWRAGVIDNIEDWMERRSTDLRRLGQEADQAGREAWRQAARTGERVVAALPRDVAVLGARVLAQGGKPPSSSTDRAPGRRPSDVAAGAKAVVRRGADQALAGARGAQDAFTFGLGDHAYAGGRALLDATRGADLGAAYRDRMAAERARDQYDAQHYGAARTVGQVVGAGAQLAALGPLGAAGQSARIAQVTPMMAREVVALAKLGGAGGLASQGLSDVTRGELGTAGDYAGAALGGAAGVLAARTGRPGVAGGVMGATTSRSQDLLNGRPISEDRARALAATEALAGKVVGGTAQRWASNLPIKEKEGLGEAFSIARTRLRGDKTKTVDKSREYLDPERKKYTYPDQRTFGGELVEAKFGPRAKLSNRQTEAHEILPNYRVDHWLPQDVGVVAGLPAATLAAQNPGWTRW